MSDLGRKRRGGQNRIRTIPLSFEQRRFVAANDAINVAVQDEVFHDNTDTRGHRLVEAAKTFAETYDTLKETPMRSFFAIASAYSDFRQTVKANTHFDIDSAKDMLGAVRGHNLAIRQRRALDKPNRGEEITIPEELDESKTGSGGRTKVSIFSRAAAGRIFAEMVQQYYDVRLGYERDHAAPTPSR